MEPEEIKRGIPEDLKDDPLLKRIVKSGEEATRLGLNDSLLEHAKKLREAGLSSALPPPEVAEKTRARCEEALKKTVAVCMESRLQDIFDQLRVGDLVLVDFPDRKHCKCRVIGFEIRQRSHSVEPLQSWRTPMIRPLRNCNNTYDFVFGQYKFIKRIPDLSLWKRWRIFWAIRQLANKLIYRRIHTSMLEPTCAVECMMGARLEVILPDSLPTRNSIEMTEKVEGIGKEIAKNSNLEFIMFEPWQDLINGYRSLPCGFRT